MPRGIKNYVPSSKSFQEALLSEPGYENFVDRITSRIRAIRIERKMTQHDLALLVGWNDLEISLIERNSAAISLAKVRKIASALGIPVGRLLDDTVEPLPQHLPPNPLDPNYVTDPKERRLLQHWRELVPKEQRIAMLLISEMPSCRDQRYDPVARKLRFRWTNPADAPTDPLSPKVTPGMGLWLKENAEKYHGQWIAMRLGKFQYAAPTRPELIAKLTGLRDVVLINLLDLERPKFEKWSWVMTPQPQPQPSSPIPPTPSPQQ